MAQVAISGDSSGTITLAAPSVAGSTVLTLPATSGTVLNDATCGVCRAWARVNASGTVLASYNVSSVTLLATGIWKATMANALTDANYSYVGSVVTLASGSENMSFESTTSASSGSVIDPTTTQFCYKTAQNSSNNSQPHSFAVFR